MSYYIYKHLDKNGDVIYCGQTIDMKNRQSSHETSSSWSGDIFKIEYAEVYDKHMMDTMEKYYISKYKPINNKEFSDCYYSEFFEVKKELEFKEYIKEKSKTITHSKTKLIHCLNIACKDSHEKYKDIDTQSLNSIKIEIDEMIECGFINKNIDKSLEASILLLRKNYKIKLRELGMRYLCGDVTSYSSKLHKFIYEFNYLKLMYVYSICTEATPHKYSSFNFTDLVNNKLAKYHNHILNFNIIYKTPISNIKSEVPIHNTEYIEFIEEQEDYYLGFVYGLCFKINKSYIIDSNLLEEVKPIGFGFLL